VSRAYDCGIPADRETGIAEATAAVRRGELVVLPTDTVYGVGADAFAPAAVDSLLVAKGRGRDMPVPVLVASPQMLEGVVDRMPDLGRRLAEEFWPGALTLVVRHTPHLAWDLGEARGTVAVRMPAHPVALELIGRTGPLAVSSANRSGHPPATTMAQAEAALGDAVAVYLDGGACADSTPSTIVDLTDTTPRLLRVGALAPERLREILPDLAPPT
jgi:tRNA threonylcarbamoyl adenosine modification protein (Sua5/YciO/YrdC/YwlC family)